MKKNNVTANNSWFLFFVVEIESNAVSDQPLSEAMNSELVPTFSINEDESIDPDDSSESTDDENGSFTERGVDPARTRGVDPARTRGVDPARKPDEE